METGTLLLSEIDVKIEMRSNVPYNSVKIKKLNRKEYFGGPSDEDTNPKIQNCTL